MKFERRCSCWLRKKGSESKSWPNNRLFGPIAELLRLALLNLVHNAIRYSGDGTAIWLRIKSREKTVLIEVADEGPGIALNTRRKSLSGFIAWIRRDLAQVE